MKLLVLLLMLCGCALGPGTFPRVQTELHVENLNWADAKVYVVRSSSDLLGARLVNASGKGPIAVERFRQCLFTYSSGSSNNALVNLCTTRSSAFP